MLNHITECIQVDIFGIELLNRYFNKLVSKNDSYIWLDVFNTSKNCSSYKFYKLSVAAIYYIL